MRQNAHRFFTASPVEEEIAHAICTNYFPEGVDPAYLTDEFYESFGE
jgi:hypothetical protein